MTILELCNNNFYIKKPYMCYLQSRTSPFWSETSQSALCINISGSNQKRYEEYYIERDSVYGYKIDEYTHSIIFLLKYNRDNLYIQFETQDEYDRGVTIIHSVFPRPT